MNQKKAHNVNKPFFALAPCIAVGYAGNGFCRKAYLEITLKVDAQNRSAADGVI
ncbi:hypothetical protein [Leptospira kmetyi]|uniref:hypothetical protein n=1 Tax=Leptospira kmetyi TaxID=408139 RepID=UPI0013FD99DF|nr:hypothetical protein [Leptospira kmetyi]